MTAPAWAQWMQVGMQAVLVMPDAEGEQQPVTLHVVPQLDLATLRPYWRVQVVAPWGTFNGEAHFRRGGVWEVEMEAGQGYAGLINAYEHALNSPAQYPGMWEPTMVRTVEPDVVVALEQVAELHTPRIPLRMARTGLGTALDLLCGLLTRVGRTQAVRP